MKNGDSTAASVFNNDGFVGNENKGLTKREQFAAMAMQGLLSGDTVGLTSMADTVRISVAISDALLQELDK